MPGTWMRRGGWIARGVACGFLAACTYACASGAGPAAGGAASGGIPRRAGPPPAPATAAELSAYQVTSSVAQAYAFVAELERQGLPIRGDTIGTTSQGTPILAFVASRPLFGTPDAARKSGRPVVYVNANIHAGEVEGKEALLALVRDLLQAPAPNALDSIVLIGVPMYNPDGNERLAGQRVNRPEQRGPEMVGTRANAQGFDLNRDYIKAEAPETRASLVMFAKWDPDVYVDLHATDGSYHGFALTYSPSLTPAATSVNTATDLVRTVLLPELRDRMDLRGFKTFDYGNFDGDESDHPDLTATTKRNWATYDHRPRFGTNYFGLRGRVSILSEAYSHDPFARRVASTYAFVDEILSLAGRHARELDDLRNEVAIVPGIPVRARLTTRPIQADVPFEILTRTGNSARDTTITQPGVPAGLRRTGKFKTQRMPVYDRFDPVGRVDVPVRYLLKGISDQVADLLRLHGLSIEPVSRDTSDSGFVFTVDSIIHAERPFQGHRQTRVVGRWAAAAVPVVRGDYLLTVGTRWTALSAYLLDPESDDGLLNWNVFDDRLEVGGSYPVIRLLH